MSDVQIDEGTRYYAAFMHGSVLIGVVWGFFDTGFLSAVPVLVIPVVMWLLRSSDPFIHQHGKNIFFFVVLWSLYLMLGSILLWLVLAVKQAPEAQVYVMLASVDGVSSIEIIVYGMKALFKNSGWITGLMLSIYFMTILIYTTLAPAKGVRNALRGRKSAYTMKIWEDRVDRG